MSQAATSPCMKLLNRVPACVAAPCLCCLTLSWLSWRAHTSGILCLHLPHHPPARIPFSAVFLLLFVVRRRRAAAQAEAESNKQSVDITALRQGRLTMQTEGEEEQQEEEEEEEGLGPLAGNRHRVSMLAAATKVGGQPDGSPPSIYVLSDPGLFHIIPAAAAAAASAAAASAGPASFLQPPMILPGEGATPPALPSYRVGSPVGSGSPANASLGSAAAVIPRRSDMELAALELLVSVMTAYGSSPAAGGWWEAGSLRSRIVVGRHVGVCPTHAQLRPACTLCRQLSCTLGSRHCGRSWHC